MKLLPEEQKISEYGSLILTTHRLRQEGGHRAKRQRTREVASIRLEHITHCQITSGDRPAFIVVGLLLIVAGMAGGSYARDPLPAFLGLILGLAMIVGYFTDRFSEVEIATPSLTLHQRMSKNNLEAAQAFVHTIEWAAIERSESRAAPEPRHEPARIPEMDEVEYWGG